MKEREATRSTSKTVLLFVNYQNYLASLNWPYYVEEQCCTCQGPETKGTGHFFETYCMLVMCNAMIIPRFTMLF